MNLAINGSYYPYFYVTLLQAGLFFLQRMNHLRRRSSTRGESTSANVLIDFYCALAAIVATVLNWGTLGLSVYVGYRVGVPCGVVFFVVALSGGMLLPMMVPSGFGFDLIGHIVSLYAVPYLVILILHSI